MARRVGYQQGHHGHARPGSNAATPTSPSPANQWRAQRTTPPACFRVLGLWFPVGVTDARIYIGNQLHHPAPHPQWLRHHNYTPGVRLISCRLAGRAGPDPQPDPPGSTSTAVSGARSDHL